MRSSSLAVLLLLCVLGCQRKVIVVVQHPADAPPGAEIIHVPAEDPATIAEIDAARKFTFDSDRERVLRQIAQRRPLCPAVQPHLVNVAVECMTFDSGREAVLLALVRNPYFSNQGKVRVLERLDGFTFDSGRSRVMDAINRRGQLPY